MPSKRRNDRKAGRPRKRRVVDGDANVTRINSSVTERSNARPMTARNVVARFANVCRNCRRMDGRPSSPLSFVRVVKQEVNTCRSFCNFVASDMPRFFVIVLCSTCCEYLQRNTDIEPNDWRYLWPGFVWRMFLDNFSTNAIVDLWSVIPVNWRGWWCHSLNGLVLHRRELFCIDGATPTEVMDVTSERNQMLDAERTMEIKKLLYSWDGLLMPRVLCPWGCTEYYDLCGMLPFDSVIQRLVPRAIIKLTPEGRKSLPKCVSCRHDLLKCEKRGLLDNPEWSVWPSVAFDCSFGLRWLTCKTCNGGRMKMVLHLPRLPQTLVSSFTTSRNTCHSNRRV